MNELVIEVLSLSLYVLYMFFSFCDGFGLRLKRKILWALCLVFLSAWSVHQLGHFDLKIILLISSLLGLILARLQRRDNQRLPIK